MVTFLICWCVVSVLGTLVALTMIRAGKKQEREILEHTQLAAPAARNEKAEDQHRPAPMGITEPWIRERHGKG